MGGVLRTCHWRGGALMSRAEGPGGRQAGWRGQCQVAGSARAQEQAG